MDQLNAERECQDLLLKIGIHECLAVMLNERQDYFGQTVNIASRVPPGPVASDLRERVRCNRSERRGDPDEQRGCPDPTSGSLARHHRRVGGV